MQNVKEFLTSYHMHPDQIDPAQALKQYNAELEAGLSGEKSSLMMIPSYVTLSGKLPEHTNVAVMDAGGTNLRVGLCAIENGELELQYVRHMPMLGVGEELESPEFLERLADLLEPLPQKTDRLGFCFSFPADITPELDAVILGFNKFWKAAGIFCAILQWSMIL